MYLKSGSEIILKIVVEFYTTTSDRFVRVYEVEIVSTYKHIVKSSFIWCESDESIISAFICYLSPIYLDFICFYFLSRTILLQLQVTLFQEQIFERLHLGAKERLFGGDSGQKYEDSVQKYRHRPCQGGFQRPISTRKVGTTVPLDLLTTFCCFSSSRSRLF